MYKIYSFDEYINLDESIKDRLVGGAIALSTLLPNASFGQKIDTGDKYVKKIYNHKTVDNLVKL